MAMVINKFIAAAVIFLVILSYVVIFAGSTVRGFIDFFLLSLITVIFAASNAALALAQRKQRSAPRHPLTLITNITSIGVLLLICALFFMLAGGSPTAENGSNVGAGLVMLGVHLFAFFNASLVLASRRPRPDQPTPPPAAQPPAAS